MMKIIYFEFDEKSFNFERKKMKKLIDSSIKNKKKLIFLKPVPPCLFGSKFAKKSFLHKKKVIVFSKDYIIINHNINYMYFRDGKIAIDNTYRMKNKFLVGNCKKCMFFLNHKCVGLFNKLFINEKKLLENKFSKFKYKAIRKVYESGFLAFGSICSQNKCKFCYQKYLPDNLVINIPFLSILEIKHFMNYFLGTSIGNIGANPYCGSGEFFDHPDFMNILLFIKKECYPGQPIGIITNALRLNYNLLMQIKKFDPNIAISAHFLNIRKRKELMQYSFDFDLKKIFKYLDDLSILYSVWFTVFKSSLHNGELEKDIFYVAKNTKSDYIYLNLPINSKFLPSKKCRNDLNVSYDEYTKFFYLMRKKYSFKQIDAQRINQRVIKRVFKSLYDCFKNKEPNIIKIMFHTFGVQKIVNSINFKKINIVPISIKPITFGSESSGCTEGLLIDDILYTYKENQNRIPENSIIILPKLLFNDDLDDYSLNNISKLRHFIKNKILLI